MFPSVFNISSINGTNGFIINGHRKYQDYSFGAEVVNIGDFTGDGISDLVITIPGANCGNGQAVVLYGSKSGFPSVVNVTLDFGMACRQTDCFIPSTYVINNLAAFPSPCTGGAAYYTTIIVVDAVGDINGDGFADMAVTSIAGAPNVLCIVFGVGNDNVYWQFFNLENINGNNGFCIKIKDNSSFAVSGLNDFNGDGIDDFAFIIGNEAIIYVVFGCKTCFVNEYDISKLNGTNGFYVISKLSSAFYIIQKLGDFNGDGLSDFVIGARGTSSDSQVFVIFGSKNHTNPNFDLGKLNGANGFFSAQYLSSQNNNAGDLNGDGLSDLVIFPTTHLFNYTICVIFGTRTDIGPVFVLSQINGTNGFCSIDNGINAVSILNDINGDNFDDISLSLHANFVIVYGQKAFTNPFSFFKSQNNNTILDIPLYDVLTLSIETIDINGDGKGDMVIGAPCEANFPYFCTVGVSQVYVFYGGSLEKKTITINQLDGTNGFVINYYTANFEIHELTSCAGDINGDGIQDLMITSPNQLNQQGQGTIIFGYQSNFYLDINLPLHIELGFNINGIISTDNMAAHGIGDFNGDGIDDLIVCADNAYVYFGSTSSFPLQFSVSTLNGVNGFIIAQDCAVAKGVGDINNDSFADIIINNLVVFGRKYHEQYFNMSEINGKNGFYITGDSWQPGDIDIVSGRGDVNGDGVEDLSIICSSKSVCVIFGQADFSVQFNIKSLDGKNGFVIYIDNHHIVPQITNVVISGDINGDKIDDIILYYVDTSSPSCQFFYTVCVGQIDVFFGSKTGFASVIYSSGLDGKNGFVIDTNDINPAFGSSVAVGDINGDGYDDILFGAQIFNTSTDLEYGGLTRVYCVYGSNNFTSSIVLENTNNINGFVIEGALGGKYANSIGNGVSSVSVSADCDFNNDSIKDIVIGTPGDGNGRSYVIFGQPAQPEIPLSPSSPVPAPPYETPWWEYLAITAGSAAAIGVVGLAYFGYYKYKNYISSTAVETEFNELIGENNGVI